MAIRESETHWNSNFSSGSSYPYDILFHTYFYINISIHIINSYINHLTRHHRLRIINLLLSRVTGNLNLLAQHSKRVALDAIIIGMNHTTTRTCFIRWCWS